MTNEHKPSERSLKVARLLLADEYTSKKLDYRIALALDASLERAPKRLSESELEEAACETFVNWNGSWDSAFGEPVGFMSSGEFFNGMRHCYLVGFEAGYRLAMGERE
jgi:hypothetical protein